MIRKRWAKDAGVTLVELLVVLAVLGLLGGLAAAGLRTASEGWQRVVRHNDDGEELLAVKSMLRQLLAQIYPQRIGGSVRGAVRFGGASDSLEFLAPLAQRFGAQDIVMYAINFPGDGTLRVAWRLDRQSVSGQKSFAPAATAEVLEGFSEGHFSFFGRADGDGAVRWWNNWQGRRSLPQLLRIRFVWRGQPDELVVAPLLTAGVCSVEGSDAPCAE